MAVSVVICTYKRPGSLNEALLSLSKQTFKDFEIILLTEKGDLSQIRQTGLQSARGGIVSFIDDDVYCPPVWLENTVKSFREGAVGVTGPTYITSEFKKNRDCLKYRRLRQYQEWMFKVPTDPGKLSPYGAPSMASNDEGNNYNGEVEYLEACNMSVNKYEALNAGGFDHHYIRTSEWCEVDLALRLGKRGRLVFSRLAALYHRPSQAGVYKHRLSTVHRWRNFVYFQRRWIKPSFRRHLYWAFVWTYFKLKGYGLF